MSKKVQKKENKAVVEYAVVSLPHPVTGKTKNVPRIAGQRTVGLDTLIARLEQGNAANTSKILLKTHFEMIMGEVRRALEQGEAVNVDGYFRMQPYLKGSVSTAGELTSKNTLAVRMTPLSKLKLSLSSFAWRLKGSRAKLIP